LGLVKKIIVPTQYDPVELPIPRHHPNEVVAINGWPTYEKLEQV
jgi:hypothetical protein